MIQCRILAILCILFTMPGPGSHLNAAPQTDPPDRPLAGVVLDGQNQPVPGADVWLMHCTDPDGEVFDHSCTDSKGAFRLTLPSRWVNGGQLRQGVVVIAYKNELGLSGASYASIALPGENGCKLVLAPRPGDRLQFIRPDKTPAANARVSVTGLSLPSLRLDFGSPDEVRAAAQNIRFRIYETPNGPGLGKSTVPLPDELRRIFTGTTQADGSISFPGLSLDLLGSLQIEAEGLGRQHGVLNNHVGNTRGVEVPNLIQLAAAGTLTGNLRVPDHAALQGSRVLIETRTLADAGMPASAFELRGQAEVRPDAEGRFTVPKLAAGSVNLHVHLAPNTPFLLPQNTSFPKLDPGASLIIDVQLHQACRVTGSLRAKDTGKPLSQVAFRLIPQGLGDLGPTGYTDQEGNYFGLVLPGKLQRQFGDPDGYLPPNIPWNQDLSVAPGLKETTLPPLQCERPLDLRVHVVDGIGKPRPGATVHVLGTRYQRGMGYRMPKEWTEPTNEIGVVVLDALDHRSVILLEARDGTAFTEKALQIKSRSQESIDLRVGSGKGAALSGQVLDGAGKPVAGAQIQIWARCWLRENNSGIEIRRPHLHALDGGIEIRTDADGRYRTPAELFAMNDYAVQAIKPGSQSNRSEWFTPELMEKSKGQVNLVAYPMQVISGSVRSTDGKPVAGARVMYTAAQSPNRETRTLDDGSFRLPEVNTTTGFVIVRQPGFRTDGKRLTAAERTTDFVLVRSDSAPGPILRSLPPPMPESERHKLATKLLEPLLQKALASKDENQRVRPLETLAKLDPARALSLLQSHPFKEVWYNDYIRNQVVQRLSRDSPDEALAIIESMQRAWWRASAYVDVARSRAATDTAGRRKLLGQALIQARAESEAPYRIVELAKTATFCFDMGDVAQATDILRSADADAKALPTSGFAAYARGCFAESLVRIELPAALALLAGLKDAREFDRHHNNIAQILAATNPAESERIVALVRDSWQREQRIPYIAYRMAPVDPTRALRLVDGMRVGTSKARGLGLLARALSEKDKPLAEKTFRQAFELLCRLVADGDAQFNNMFDGATLAGSLLPEMERHSPELVQEFLWETVALRHGEVGSRLQEQSLLADNALAMMLARYDLQMARTLVEPWSRDVKVDRYRGIRNLIGAMTLIDPNWAVATIERLPDLQTRDTLSEEVLRQLVPSDAEFWSGALRKVGLEFDDKEF